MPADDAPPPLRLGASRSQPRAAAALPRLAAAISARLGLPVTGSLRDGYEDLHEAFRTGAVDFAWLPPLLHARVAAQGARPLAVPMRGGAVTYRSAILVATDAPWRELADLQGARAAWVDHWSASGYHFPRLELLLRGLDPAEALRSEIFQGSPLRAATAVAAGEADLCACFVTESAAERPHAEEDVRRILGPLAERLRILHVTGSIPPDGVVAASRVPRELAARIAAALLRLHDAADGQEVLRDLLQADLLCAPDSLVEQSLQIWSAVGG